MSLVSVIIPTYNRAQYIAGCIDSVVGQSHRETEIIVVDDGSSDDTVEVLRPYFLKISFIRQRHAGVSAARNRGLAAAKGEYIAFLDSDDLWRPEKLSRQLGVLRSDSSIGACHTGADIIDENENVIQVLSDDRSLVQSGMILDAMLLWRCRVFLSSLLVRRQCIEGAGMFDETLRTGEDWHFIMRCARRYRFGYLPAKLLQRRAHAQSLTSNAYSSSSNNATFLSLQKVLELFPDIDRPMRRKAFEIRYFHYGYINFRRRNYRLARKFFRCALGCSAANLRTYAFFLLSFVPRLAESLYPEKFEEGVQL